MSTPVVFITIGAVAGAVIGWLDGGGALGREISDYVTDGVATIYSQFNPNLHPRATPELGDLSRNTFSACLKSRGGVEATLRDLIEFHEHDATVQVVDCLLGGDPRRFCTAEGRAQAADAMEIYYWSKEDARRSSAAHGLALKIHLLDRAAGNGEAAASDPYALTWAGPGDRTILDRVTLLAKEGWLDPGVFAFSGRAELRDAMRDVKSDATPCDEPAEKRAPPPTP